VLKRTVTDAQGCGRLSTDTVACTGGAVVVVTLGLVVVVTFGFVVVVGKVVDVVDVLVVVVGGTVVVVVVGGGVVLVTTTTRMRVVDVAATFVESPTPLKLDASSVVRITATVIKPNADSSARRLRRRARTDNVTGTGLISPVFGSSGGMTGVLVQSGTMTSTSRQQYHATSDR
jgi:hypothetical protein